MSLIRKRMSWLSAKHRTTDRRPWPSQWPRGVEVSFKAQESLRIGKYMHGISGPAAGGSGGTC
jgi:hypothetical protein